MFKKVIVLIVNLIILVYSEPELKGTPTELGNYLSNIPPNITISSEGIILTDADVIKISLNIVTEDESFEKAIISACPETGFIQCWC
jgi:hypothetical protein